MVILKYYGDHIQDMGNVFWDEKDDRWRDLEIVAKNGKVDTHKFLLVNQFPVLKEMLCDDCDKKHNKTSIILPDVKIEDVKHALEQLYKFSDNSALSDIFINILLDGKQFMSKKSNKSSRKTVVYSDNKGKKGINHSVNTEPSNEIIIEEDIQLTSTPRRTRTPPEKKKKIKEFYPVETESIPTVNQSSSESRISETQGNTELETDDSQRESDLKTEEDQNISESFMLDSSSDVQMFASSLEEISLMDDTSVFQCTQCQSTLDSVDAEHSCVPQIQVDAVIDNTAGEELLDTHYESIVLMNNDVIFLCIQCKERVSRPDRQNHIEHHQQPQIAEKDPPKKNRKKRITKKSFLKTTLDSGKKALQCKKCMKTYRSLASARRHVGNCNVTSTKLEDDKNKKKENLPVTAANSVDNPIENPTESVDFMKKTLSDGKQILQCKTCLKVCRNESGASRHIGHCKVLKDNNYTPIMCGECSIMCRTEHGLRVHIRMHHNLTSLQVQKKVQQANQNTRSNESIRARSGRKRNYKNMYPK